ncbi:MAG: hypothetical protein ABJB86_24110 [Bacteroidota bacterium]
MRLFLLTALIIAFFISPLMCTAQDSTSLLSRLTNIPGRIFKKVNDRTAALENKIAKQTERILERLEKRENNLKRDLSEKDSTKAIQLFSESASQYTALSAKLRRASDQPAVYALKEYIPRLDSFKTALKFLQQGYIGLPTDKLQQFTGVGDHINQLESQLQVANEVQTFIRQRERLLKDQLSPYHLESELLGMNKEVYYYQAQLVRYKYILNDPEKLQETIVSAVARLPLFERFWQKNSYFATLFPIPDNSGTPQALAGLQTRDQLKQELQQKFGVARISVSGKEGTGGAGYLNQQMQQAQTKLAAIKSKLAQFGGSSAMTMPDFKPNSQHGKTFLKRLQFDFGNQNNTSTYLLPSMTTLGLNIGYKINDRATAGIGVNYLLGFGNGIEHIRLSNQGAGIRMFADIKAKGDIWITGGLEYNYMQQFASIETIRNLDVWQKSILAGITKKYKVGKKENNIQLLYDFLASREVPRGQSFKFRVGFGL